jgi:hypothetical protein
MTLSKREKTLALVVGLLGVVMVTTVVGGLMVSPIREGYATMRTLRSDVEKREQELDAARVAKKKMDDWRGRSLSTDAQGQYNDWLQDTFPGLTVTPPARTATKPGSGQPGAKAPTFVKLDYTVKGQVSLAQLIRSLYKFYLTGYLHQIHTLDIKPADKSSDLAVTVIVQVLSLPDAPPTQELPRAQPPARKPEKDVAIYVKDIADRKPFSPFTPNVPPPPPPPTPSTPKFDVLKYVFVSGIVTVDDLPEALIRDRTTDKEYRLHPGEVIVLGSFKATVRGIAGREVEFLVDGYADPIRVGLGDPLRKPADSAIKAGSGFADAKVATPAGLTEKGKSADRRGKSSGDADPSDSRGKSGRFGKKKGGLKGKQGEDAKSGQ